MAAILDHRKSLFIALLAISDQYATLIFFFTKWLPAAILDDRKSLLITFLVISDQYATFFFTKWLPAAILDDRKSLLITFLVISDQYATLFFFDFFFKMAAGRHFGSPFWAILDDRKSLSIAFLAISDKYTTFFLIFFSKWPPAAILEVRFAPKTIGFFHYVLSMAMPNINLWHS